MLTFFAILLAFFATSVRGDGIDGKIFGGGDYVDRRLVTVRTDLLRSFSLLKKGEGKESFCAWTRCPAGLSPQLCDHLNGLNEAQVGQCRATAERIATQIKTIPFALTDKALTVPDPGGKPRPVAARTELGPKGNVELQRKVVKDLSRDDLTALVAHELGHKLTPPVTDNGPAEAFASGRELLDVVGTALAVYTAIHRIPSQPPPALAKEVSQAAFCARATRGNPFVTGVAADVLGMDAPPADIPPPSSLSDEGERLGFSQKVLTSRLGRERVLHSWFDRYLKRAPAEEEKNLLLIQFNHGANYPALLASLVREAEYTHSRGIENDRDFLSALHKDVLGRNPTAAELKEAVRRMQAAGKREFLVEWLGRNQTVQQHFVGRWYRRFLNRDPWEAEMRLHVEQLRTGMDWEGIQAALLGSPEYLALQKVRGDGCRAPASVGK